MSGVARGKGEEATEWKRGEWRGYGSGGWLERVQEEVGKKGREGRKLHGRDWNGRCGKENAQNCFS